MKKESLREQFKPLIKFPSKAPILNKFPENLQKKVQIALPSTIVMEYSGNGTV